MNGASLLNVLLILGAAATAAFLVIVTLKSLAGLKEEDVVILDPAETRLAAEQAAVIAKVERLTLWAKYTGFAALAILVAAGGIWMYRAMLAFNGQPVQ